MVRPVLLACLVAWCCSGGAAQGSRVVEIEHADSLVGRVIEGEEVRELIGNVRLRQERIVMACDRALQYIASGKVQLTGHVVVVDSNITMTAPRGMFFRDDKRAEAYDDVVLDDGSVHLTARAGEYFVNRRTAYFRDHVVVRDTGSVMSADSLTYFRDEKRSIATGTVRLHHFRDNVTLYGGRVDHRSARQYTKVTRDPVLVQIDSAAGGDRDTLIVRGIVMESFRDSVRRLIATDSVRILRSTLSATCGIAVMYTDGDSLLLRTAPVVWYEQTQVTGDSINVYLEHRRLRRVSVMGSAFAASQEDSLRPDRFDQLSGETMQMYFAGRALHMIDVDTRATSVYYVYEGLSPNGLNKISGDRVLLTFDHGRILDIRVYAGVQGSYIPENLVSDRETEYALPGLHWRSRRPVMQTMLPARRGGFDW